MKYNLLGQSQIPISQIGFGAWGIGGLTPGNTSYGSTSDVNSLNALARAFESGINFFDTANIYGDGHSESLIGTAFKGKRNKVVIATKCGMIDTSGTKDFTISALEQSLNRSLKRLQSDYVDLLQFHDMPVERASNELLIEWVSRLKKTGIIRLSGVTVKSPSDGLHFLNGYWDCIQCNLNLIDQRAVTCGLLSRAKECNVGLIARTPLAFGFLTGQFVGKNLDLPNGDHRSRWTTEQLRIWADAPKLFDTVLKASDRSMVELALTFCTSFEAVTTTIPGMLTANEVDANLRAVAGSRLTEQEIATIACIYKNNSFFKS